MTSRGTVTISAVIPTHDRPALLREALAAVGAQTRAPDEVIVVDNGGTPADVSEVALAGLRVMRIAPHAGAARARNAGVEAAASSFVSFLDDDDLWAPDYLERVESAILRDDPDYVIGRMDRLLDGEVVRYRAASEVDRLLDAVWVTNPGVGGPNSTVRRETFLRLGGYDPELITSEDRSLLVEFLLASAKVVAEPEAAAIAREHSGDRLSDPRRMAEGKRRFLAKYAARMPAWARLRNRAVIAFQGWRADRNPLRLLETGAFVVAARVARVGARR